ncbi:MAG: DUF488 domain-containing protein [Planctomycetaceae bacterium]
MRQPLFTIGHSNHSLAHFILLLRRHGVTAVADVRSTPYSRRHPHFRQTQLAEALHATVDIAYVYLGQQLGARPDDPECFNSDGQVSYARLASSLSFRNGIKRVLTGAANHRIALMCVEWDPLQCHRGILLAPRLRPEVPGLYHIGPDGEPETFEEAEARLLRMHHLPDHGLFDTHAELVLSAYRRQEAAIAWRKGGKAETEPGAEDC